MTLVYEERLSDSPYVESVTHGWTVSDGSTIRPAEISWHMIFSRVEGQLLPLIVGPLPTSGVVSWGADAEILWLKFKPGVFMPHHPTKKFLNSETTLPEAASRQSFWLKGSAWQAPDYENVDTFVSRLIRDEILVHDPVVMATLQDELPDMSPRTLRYRFSQATGLSESTIRQIARAQQAADLLRQGMSILDTVYEAGYFDQPHLTRSLKQYIGYTPAQIFATGCHSVQDPSHEVRYDETVLA